MEKYPESADDKVIIELSRAEALVLFELLSRWSESGADSVPIEHQAEQRVLWNLEAVLERTLHEPFRADYDDLLAQARQTVADGT